MKLGLSFVVCVCWFLIHAASSLALKGLTVHLVSPFFRLCAEHWVRVMAKTIHSCQ